MLRRSSVLIGFAALCRHFGEHPVEYASSPADEAIFGPLVRTVFRGGGGSRHCRGELTGCPLPHQAGDLTGDVADGAPQIRPEPAQGLVDPLERFGMGVAL